MFSASRGLASVTTATYYAGLTKFFSRQAWLNGHKNLPKSWWLGWRAVRIVIAVVVGLVVVREPRDEHNVCEWPKAKARRMWL